MLLLLLRDPCSSLHSLCWPSLGVQPCGHSSTGWLLGVVASCARMAFILRGGGAESAAAQGTCSRLACRRLWLGCSRELLLCPLCCCILLLFVGSIVLTVCAVLPLRAQFSLRAGKAYGYLMPLLLL